MQKPLKPPLEYHFEDVPEFGDPREVAPGVFWLRLPLPMALDHINVYLLEDEDGWWIIDTGIALGPTEQHWLDVFDSHLDNKPVKAVLATHYHPDHLGLAGWLCERWQAPFFMTQTEYLSGLSFSRMEQKHFSWTSELHLKRAGFSDDEIDQARQRFSGFGAYITPMPTAYRRLADGMTLSINGHDWQVIVGRGHCPEHACLYSRDHGVLISGDQVIPRITSNISVMASEPEANPLKDWLASHVHFVETLPDDVVVLPAHDAPFRGLHDRLKHLSDHHHEHLVSLWEACVGASPNALELLPVLFNRKLDDNSVPLALGECIAHLNYLYHAGHLEREINPAGQYTYRACDDAPPQASHAMMEL
ncbi:MAG: MBL fold metallo-hydrolase [Pseudomonadota bacterium]